MIQNARLAICRERAPPQADAFERPQDDGWILVLKDTGEQGKIVGALSKQPKFCCFGAQHGFVVAEQSAHCPMCELCGLALEIGERLGRTFGREVRSVVTFERLQLDRNIGLLHLPQVAHEALTTIDDAFAWKDSFAIPPTNAIQARVRDGPDPAGELTFQLVREVRPMANQKNETQVPRCRIDRVQTVDTDRDQLLLRVLSARHRTEEPVEISRCRA